MHAHLLRSIWLPQAPVRYKTATSFCATACSQAVRLGATDTNDVRTEAKFLRWLQLQLRFDGCCLTSFGTNYCVRLWCPRTMRASPLFDLAQPPTIQPWHCGTVALWHPFLDMQCYSGQSIDSWCQLTNRATLCSPMPLFQTTAFPAPSASSPAHVTRGQWFVHQYGVRSK